MKMKLVAVMALIAFPFIAYAQEKSCAFEIW